MKQTDESGKPITYWGGLKEDKQKTNKIMSENMTREQKLETIVKIFSKVMFYGNWKWETPNERVIEMLMRELDLYPFPNEDAMIFSTKVDENLYAEAVEKVKV